MAATIARMTARDGLSFQVFSSSPDLRKALLAMGFSDLPKSATSIQKMVMDHGGRVRSVVTGEMQKLKKQGHRFSLTFDEWTSNRNRRYMCVNVHANAQFWSLGMIRVHGSMPAEKCVELLEQKLSDFGLSLNEDIVCICTDGASVMTKVGKLMKADQQLCFAHGIQLAVLDVLYNRPATHTLGEIQPDCPVASKTSPDSDDNDDDNVDIENKETFSVTEYDVDVEDIIAELSDEYQQLVNKVRAVVKIFKRSPTKNDAVLQKYVVMEQGHEIRLALDCRTRWSSLWNMLEIFYKLRNPIQKACIDVRAAVNLTEADFETVREIVSALEPLKVTVEALCRRETNLVAADAALKFAIIELEKQTSELSRTLAAALRKRVT